MIKWSFSHSLFFACLLFLSSDSYGFFGWSNPLSREQGRAALRKVCAKMKTEYVRNVDDSERGRIKDELRCIQQFLDQKRLGSHCSEVIQTKLTSQVIHALSHFNKPQSSLMGSSCSSVEKPLVPSLLEILDGAFMSLDFSRIREGDLIFAKRGVEEVSSLAPHVLSEHMLVLATTSEQLARRCKESQQRCYFHSVGEGIAINKEPPTHVGADKRVAVFRFFNNPSSGMDIPAGQSLIKNMLPFLEMKFKSEAPYSFFKAVKSYLTQGRLKPNQDDDLRTIEVLLKQRINELNRFTLNGYWATPPPELKDSAAEFCASYAGNAAKLGAMKLRMRLASYYDNSKLGPFSNAVDALREAESDLYSDVQQPLSDEDWKKKVVEVHEALDKKIRASAKELLKNKETRELLEFGTSDTPRSPLFDRDMGQMTPATLIEYLTGLSSSDCTLIDKSRPPVQSHPGDSQEGLDPEPEVDSP